MHGEGTLAGGLIEGARRRRGGSRVTATAGRAPETSAAGLVPPPNLSTAAEHLVWALGAQGVEVIFLNPGTDTAPLQEAFLALPEKGLPVPRVVGCTYESVALAAAHGYWQVTRRPQCVVVHVDVGTQNLGAMAHNVLRDRAGVVVLAGKTPYGEDATSVGGRSTSIHWQQDVPDQMGILRGYSKWGVEIARADIVGRAVGRALQVAASGVPGLAYLMVSRDVLMERPSVPPGERHDGYAMSTPPAGDDASLEEVAAMLAGAEAPVLVTSRIGRHPGAAAVVTELAELVGLQVLGRAESVNIASDHPLYVRSPGRSARALAEADVVLVVACDVPWIPAQFRPAPGARIVHIDPDPVKTDMPLWSFPSDVSLTADGATALGQLLERLRARAGEGPGSPAARWRSRRERLEAESAQRGSVAGRREGAAEAVTAESVVAALNEVLRDDDIVVEEAVTNAGALQEGLDRRRPGTLFQAGGPGLGWALGGSVGIKMARPAARVVAVVGDGSFMFGVPTAALTLANEAGAPFVSVILDNREYRASRRPVMALFPEGTSVVTRRFPGTTYAGAPDFARLAEACHAHGETVASPGELVPALRRAFAAVDGGRPAVVDVQLAAAD